MAISQYAINIDTITIDQIRSIDSFISKERKERAYKYIFDIDIIRCIIGETLIRYTLIKRYNLTNEEIILRISPYGKPFIQKEPSIYFNISHSGSWVVCAIGDQPVGIDVEKVSNNNLEIAKHFFTYYEYERIYAYSVDSEKYREFYKLWTLKESYIKAIGLGLRKALNTFEFHQEQGEEYLYINNKRDNKYLFVNKQLAVNYQLSLCTKITEVNTIQIIEWNDLECVMKRNGYILTDTQPC